MSENQKAIETIFIPEAAIKTEIDYDPHQIVEQVEDVHGNFYNVYSDVVQPKEEPIDSNIDSQSNEEHIDNSDDSKSEDLNTHGAKNNGNVESDVPMETTTNNTGDSNKRKRKTAAQYQREYRARVKARRVQDVMVSVIKRTRKSAAEYQRAYRVRKKFERDNNPRTSSTADPSTDDQQSSAGPSTIDSVDSTHSKRRKSAADYQREYRLRKKSGEVSARHSIALDNTTGDIFHISFI